MTIREYQELLANLIAERDKIFNQIALLKSEAEQRHHFSMYGVSTNAEMIREVTAVLAQAGKWHYPEKIEPLTKGRKMFEALTATENAIAEVILEVVDDKWMTILQIQSKISMKLGIDPNDIEDIVSLCIGFLIGHNKIEHKQVTPKRSKGYFYVCRKPQSERR